MKTWIGPSENLQEADVVIGWSRSHMGTATLQVERVDADTVKIVLDLVRKGLREHGNVDPEDLYQLGKRLGVQDEKVLAEDKDLYYDSDDMHAARQTVARDVLRDVDAAMPGPGPRGREGWKQRLAEKYGVVL